MKKQNILYLITITAFLTAMQFSPENIETLLAQQSDPWAKMKRYKVKSGIIEYKMTGMQKGKETICFDRWGMREAKITETKISMGPITQETRQLTLLLGNWTYNVDLKTMTGTRIETPMLRELAEKHHGENLTDIGMKMFKQMGAVKIGTETIAGKLCDIYEIKQMGTKVWIWKGLALKTVAGFAGMGITSTAVSVKVNIAVPKSKLELPPNAKISEGQNPMEMLKRFQKNAPKIGAMLSSR